MDFPDRKTPRHPLLQRNTLPERKMTVSELMKKLAKIPPDMEIMECSDGVCEEQMTPNSPETPAEVAVPRLVRCPICDGKGWKEWRYQRVCCVRCQGTGSGRFWHRDPKNDNGRGEAWVHSVCGHTVWVSSANRKKNREPRGAS